MKNLALTLLIAIAALPLDSRASACMETGCSGDGAQTTAFVRFSSNVEEHIQQALAWNSKVEAITFPEDCVVKTFDEATMRSHLEAGLPLEAWVGFWCTDSASFNRTKALIKNASLEVNPNAIVTTEYTGGL